jgi:hypothetical protein
MFESAAMLLASRLIFSKTTEEQLHTTKSNFVSWMLTRTADRVEITGSLKDIPISELPQLCSLSYAWGTNHQPLRSFVALRVWQLQCTCFQESSEWAAATQHHGSGSMLSASIR